MVFTGGIGENDPFMRARILSTFTHLGLFVDAERNICNARCVTTAASKVAALVIPTNEELVIARETFRLVKNTSVESEAGAAEIGRMVTKTTMSRILIIDDEPVLRLTLRYFLEQAGHEIWDAENGRVGVEICRSAHPDLVVTDIMMPEQEGVADVSDSESGVSRDAGDRNVGRAGADVYT